MSFPPPSSEVLEVNLKELATKDDLKNGLRELEMKIDGRFEKLWVKCYC
jgi:hypothetical protein